MPARCIPPDPAFTTQSEREVWEALRQQLGDDAVLMANLRLLDDEGDHEIDLVAMIPGAGIVVIEVKGATVSQDPQGQWQLRSREGTRRIDPAGQLTRSKYALVHYIENDPHWSRTRVRWGHALVTPYTHIDEGFSSPDLPRFAIHGRDDLPHLAERLATALQRQETGHRVPSDEDVEAVLTIWRGRHRIGSSVVAEADEREATVDRLTQEQAMLLRVTRLLRRVDIRGGAGSGKTVLALSQAKELTRGSGTEGRPAQRAALLCYSIGLATYLQREIAAAPRKHRPAYVGTFHGLGMTWGAPDGDRTDSPFWEDELPAIMLELAQQLPEKEKFDSIVVDEAQDFAESWWAPLLAALRDPDEGGLYIYSDENQRLFPRFGRPPIELVPLVLDHNLRNTRPIAESFESLAPSRMRSLGGDGPDVTFVPASAEDALDLADDQVDRLLDEGWEPRHVALITTKSRHPVQLDLQESRGDEGYWESFWDEDEVFYGTVLGCKGMERRGVVLCINSADTERARERLYVGMSRATDRLIVVGDPDWIREVGGERVARRLGVTP
ncbi:NERD domain-containing protein [Ornithinimicrobium sp. F0845]|uniref:nuclease-related domain-containing DEAD/DEAH box helicase n=1 Tax=Ornithinimicrobium sp. F0845 TaxID=2926412 RepID=UPI001FF4081C|nr:NERD domain-containing protein [Ornithinimicrobium sp. F0845]